MIWVSILVCWLFLRFVGVWLVCYFGFKRFGLGFVLPVVSSCFVAALFWVLRVLMGFGLVFKLWFLFVCGFTR